jgi:hypothetical protein
LPCSSPSTLCPPTLTRPATGSFQIAVRTVFPRCPTSLGVPTFTDTTTPATTDLPRRLLALQATRPRPARPWPGDPGPPGPPDGLAGEPRQLGAAAIQALFPALKARTHRPAAQQPSRSSGVHGRPRACS